MRTSALVLGLSLLALALPASAGDDPAPDAAPAPALAKAASATPAAAAEMAAAESAAAAESGADAARLRLVLARPAPKSLSEALRRLDAIRVDVKWKDMDLAEAVEFVARVAGFNAMVAPELQRDGLDALPKVTLSLRQASLKQVADLLARFTGTQIALDGNILVFTTPELARGKPVLRIYSIGELTAPIMNFPGPDMNLRPSGAEFEQEEPSEVVSELADPDKIVSMIQEFVESDTWGDDGVSISADRRKLVVRTYPHVQRKVARLLAVLRAAR